MRLLSFILLLAAALFTGCASNSKSNLTVHHINSLASSNGNNGSFKGLEYLADPVPGQLKNRVNIMYLHGIGWTEDRNSGQLAEDFLSGIAKAYDLDASDGIITTLCGEAPYNPNDPATPHIYIKADQTRYFETALPGSKLKLDELVCMDKQTLAIDDNLEFVIYRVFWDNIFWDNLQFAHVGQDDNRGSSAIRGAMCSAALDASGHSFNQQGQTVAYSDICNKASFTNIKTNQFAFVTESLGSKITLDVMQEALSDGRETIHDDMITGSETYMLANQVALLSLSDLSVRQSKPIARLANEDRPKIIAMSELNDFLSYELVPFYEQLWKRSIRPQKNNLHGLTDIVREQMMANIGFEMIDMRLEFAQKIIPLLKGFVDPKDAHSGHAGEPELMLYILCGAVNAKLNGKEWIPLPYLFLMTGPILCTFKPFMRPNNKHKTAWLA